MEVIKRCGFRRGTIRKQQRAEQKLVIYASAMKEGWQNRQICHANLTTGSKRCMNTVPSRLQE